EERACVDEPVDDVAHVVGGVGVAGDEPVPVLPLRFPGRGERGGGPEVVGQVAQQQPDRGDGLPVLVEHLVAAAGDGGVHHRAAHLLQGAVFAGDLLCDAGTGEVHG